MTLINHTLRFILIILFQILVLNNVRLGVLLNPFIYPVIILMFPANMPHWLLITLSFLTGFTVDIFSGTPGLHASACTFIGYIRPYLLRLLMPQTSMDARFAPHIHQLGFLPYLSYALLLVLFHHIIYFSLEIFDLSNALLIIKKILASSVLSMALIMLFEYLFFPASRKTRTSTG